MVVHPRKNPTLMSRKSGGSSWESAVPNPFAVMRARLHTLPEGERRIAEFALRNPEQLIRLAVTDLAALLNVSDATVVRLCQRLGYQGYREFRILTARHLLGETPALYLDLADSDDAGTVLRKTVRLSVQALQDTLSTLQGAELERATRAILGAARVVLFGVGGSGGIAIAAQQRLLRIGVLAYACTDTHTMRLLSRRLGKDAVALGITHSGDTSEVVEVLEEARARGAVTIVVTNQAGSPAANASDIVLLTGATETPLASEAGTSRIVQLAAIDALCAYIILKERQAARA